MNTRFFDFAPDTMDSFFSRHTRPIYLLLFLLLASVNLQAQKKVCITVDDLPVVGYGLNTAKDWQSVTERLLNTFKTKGIPAIGYVNEGKLRINGKIDSARVQILELWLSKGYELGNHTFSHPDYHKTEFKKFALNIRNGERIIRPMMEKYGKQLQYFRHPFLRVGETEERALELSQFLDKLQLTPAPVTLDSDDYLFAQKYAGAFRKGDKELMKKIGNDYINHTEKKLHFYETLSQAVFGRQIAQTYLCHANMLNADYLDELADMFQRNGYEFVSQTEILQDKTYQEPVTKFGPWGISWLYRWSMSRNKGKELFKQDIEVPAYIRN